MSEDAQSCPTSWSPLGHAPSDRDFSRSSSCLDSDDELLESPHHEVIDISSVTATDTDDHASHDRTCSLHRDAAVKRREKKNIWEPSESLQSPGILPLVGLAVVAGCCSLTFAALGEQTVAGIFTCVWHLAVSAAVIGHTMQYHNHQEAEVQCGDKMDFLEFHKCRRTTCPERLRKNVDKLHVRAVDLARRKTDRNGQLEILGLDVPPSDNSMVHLRTLEDVHAMVNNVKEGHNPNLVKNRWQWTYSGMLLTCHASSLVPMFSCVLTQEVPATAIVPVIVGICVLASSFVFMTQFDREAAILAPVGALWRVSFVLVTGSLGQIQFIIALSATDICEHAPKYRGSVITFSFIITSTVLLAMRMLLGKLVDYCELRVQLLAFSQHETFWEHCCASPNHSLATIYKNYPHQRRTVALDRFAALKLKRLNQSLWENWGIGLGVIILGLVPSFLKIAYAMWFGQAGPTPSEVLPEEIFVMIGTAGVLITLIATDADLSSWMRIQDLIMLSALVLLILGSQISGAILGMQAAWHSNNSMRIVIVLAIALFMVAVQLITCVWASLNLDLQLIKLMFQGHKYVSNAKLPDSDKKFPDGLRRYPNVLKKCNKSRQGKGWHRMMCCACAHGSTEEDQPEGMES